MTGNLVLDSLISLAAIALMVALARVLFPGSPSTLTEKEAQERLSFDEPDFRVQQWLIDREGRAALAQGGDHEFVLVSRLGLDLVTRRFRAGAVGAELREGSLIIRPGDPGLSQVKIRADGAADWARILTPAGVK